MKKSVAIVFLGLSLAFSSSVSAQKNIVKFVPVGGVVQTQHAGGESLTSGFYKIAVGYERVFGAKTSGQFDLGGLLGTQLGQGSMGYIKAAFKYYLLDDAPHGLNLGAYVPVAFGSLAVITGLGANVGYQMFFLDDRLAAGADLGIGFGYVAGIGEGAGGNPGANIDISVGAGYAF
ncbi:MAG: hypothetical protein ACI9FU_001047 [Granulosicoccus sp.]|jgi:hypothetical protein